MIKKNVHTLGYELTKSLLRSHPHSRSLLPLEAAPRFKLYLVFEMHILGLSKVVLCIRFTRVELLQKRFPLNILTEPELVNSKYGT